MADDVLDLAPALAGTITLEPLVCEGGPPVKQRIGPSIYSISIETDVPWSDFSASIWSLAINDGSGEELIFTDPNYHSSSPVWGTDFERILYQECSCRALGSPDIPLRLCTVNKDGTGRTVIHVDGLMVVTSADGYRNYCMSPDGLKVAMIDPSGRLRVVWADGSGDCGGGNMSYAYGNPQWSLDSQLVYVQTDVWAIAAFPFDAATPSPIYADGPGPYGYQWLSNDGQMFAVTWIPGPGQGMIKVVGVDGAVQHQYQPVDCPWYGPRNPVCNFWTPDDQQIVIDWQGQDQGASSYPAGATAVISKPDLSSWRQYSCLDNPPGAVSDFRGIDSWTLALVNGEMKLIEALSNYDVNGIGLVAFDLETGVGEWLSFTPWGTGSSLGTVWSRYAVGGLATSTAYFGTQIWDP